MAAKDGRGARDVGLERRLGLAAQALGGQGSSARAQSVPGAR